MQTSGAASHCRYGHPRRPYINPSVPMHAIWAPKPEREEREGERGEGKNKGEREKLGNWKFKSSF